MIPAERYVRSTVEWIKQFFETTGGSTAVIGISGGKDSAVCAALCKEALGPDNVLGVLMPNGEQPDIQDSIDVCEHLCIRYRTCNIGNAVQEMLKLAATDPFKDVAKEPAQLTAQTTTNIPPRIRMALLYAIAQSEPAGRVCCCSNFMESMLGWETLWGDTVGDFAPLRSFTVSEVIAMGLVLGLPRRIVCKPPADGLTGKTDEENLGFTYDEAESVLHSSTCSDTVGSRIRASQFKRDLLVGIPVAPRGFRL